MLLNLHIKNFALIDSVDLKFSEGLNILTGETGAGKSIIIDSVNFIMGDKQSKDIIRTGEDIAFVEGVFDKIDDEQLNLILSENGIAEDDFLVISREINQSGRSFSRINGKSVTVSLLKDIGNRLIDIHGQHEHQSLLDETNQIMILDSFCGSEFEKIMTEYLKTYKQISVLKSKIDALQINDDLKIKRTDMLSYQIKEIKDALLIPGEYEELEKEKFILSNAEKIYSSLSTVYEKIYEENECESAYDKIGISISNMESIEKYDIKLKEFKNSINDIYYRLEGFIEDIREYRDKIEFDPTKLDEIQLRIDLINKLKMKYGNTIEEIEEYCTKCEDELNQIEGSTELIKKLKVQFDVFSANLLTLAEKISSIRIKTSITLSKLIENELKYLGMEKAVFNIAVDCVDSLIENGKDFVYFQMSANIGEPLKPLSKVASGGESSRIMLAIKSVIAEVDKIPTLIFDEIDTGISGRAAQAVAEKMCLISKNHQILCVTHLPQIAAMADSHYKIQKIDNNSKTYTKVFYLNKNEAIDELSRMLGGAVVTELTKQHSKEMKEMGDSLKNNIRKIKYNFK